MRRRVAAGVVGLLAIVGLGIAGAARADRPSRPGAEAGAGVQPATSEGTASGRGPAQEAEWCVVHLQYGELGLESGKQSWGSSGRVRHRNDLAVAAEGRLIAFEGGWLRLACGSDGEVWVPEHAIRAVEFMTEESFQWRNGPPPGWTPERD